MTAPKKKPQRANARASQNIIPFRTGNRDMTNATAAQTTMQADAFEFGAVPLVHGPIYSVNPGTPVRFLINEADSLTEALAELAGDAVESGISPAQSWLLESNLCRLRAVINGIRQGMLTSP